MAASSWSRRRVLSSLATAGTVALAGCANTGPSYDFDTFPLGSDLAAVSEYYHRTDLTEFDASYPIDYPSEYKQSVVETLFDEGSVTVAQLPLALRSTFGTTTRPQPRFTTVDGDYYQVILTDEREITETQWVFYLDLTEEIPPSSATVVSAPPASLSDLDRAVVEEALVRTAADRSDPLDVGDYGFPYRGIRFHQHMDTEASDLIPSPPFDFYEVDGNYFAARTAEGETSVTRYEFEARKVGSSAAELQQFIEREFVDARFDPDSMSDSAIGILDTATDPLEANEYTEALPMSEELKFVTERLGMLDHMPDESEEVLFRNAIFEYDGEWYEGDLIVR